MNMTITLLVAGCATDCRHCYVGGGPGPNMPLDTYRRALDTLEPVAALLDPECERFDIALDFEPLIYPDIATILRETKNRFGDHFDVESVPTTAFPLASRSDRDEVFDALRYAGCRSLDVTLHGPDTVQDWAQARTGALERQLRGLWHAQAAGFETSLNVMLNRRMLARFDETLALVERYRCDRVRVRVPDFVPTDRLLAFEADRPTAEDLEAPMEALVALNGGEDIEYCTEADVVREVLASPEQYGGFARLDADGPQWSIQSVTRDLDMFYGNAAARRVLVGNLTSDAPEVLASRMRALGPCWHLNGFYDAAFLPPVEELAREFGDPGNTRAYMGKEDVFMRWLSRRTLARGESLPVG